MWRTGLARSLALVALLVLAGCAGSSLRQVVSAGVILQFQPVTGSGVPAFTATTRLPGSLADVMYLLTDFAQWPDWVYGCESVSVLQMIGYQETYLLQVTRLPLVASRTTILHAIMSNSEGGDEITIAFAAVPDYCLNNTRAACVAANRTTGVPVSVLAGSFRLRQAGPGEVELRWQQHFEPGGLIPDWATRQVMAQVPLKSLARFRTMLAKERVPTR